MLVRGAGDGQMTQAVSLWSAFAESPRRPPCCFVGQPVSVFTVRSGAGLRQEAAFCLAVTATLRQALASGRLCFFGRRDDREDKDWLVFFSFRLEDLIRKRCVGF